MIGKKYIESGGFSMTRTEFDVLRAKHLSNHDTKRGIELFEKYVGRINWLHPEEEKYKVRYNKRYRVINKAGEIVFEAEKLTDIAKEFCASVSRVTACVNSISLLCGEYLVERCENE